MDSQSLATTDFLGELVSTLRAALTPVTNPPSASASPMALPAPYSAEAVECGSFLLQISLYWDATPEVCHRAVEGGVPHFSATGRALLWARAIWNSQSTLINSFNAFTAHFREVFGRAAGALSVADQLTRLRQGSTSGDDYTLQFCTLAASSGWNEAALLAAYRQGLDPQIRVMMATYDDTVGLENFMQKAVKISQRLTACQPDETAHSPASPVAYPSVPEPMQVDSYRLSCTEWAWHLASSLCLYCGASGHFIKMCPSHPPRPTVSTLHVEPEISLPYHCWQYNYSPLDISFQCPPSLTRAPRETTSPKPSWNASTSPVGDKPKSSRSKQSRENRLGVGASNTDLFLCPCKWDVVVKKSSPREDLFSGTGGTHRWHHPGMPLALPTLTWSQMGFQRDPKMEWGLFPKLSLQCSCTPYENHLSSS